MDAKTFTVHAEWDAECHMWYVADSDIPGLVTEAESFEGLVDRVLAVAPELLELNGVLRHSENVPVRVLAARESLVAVH